ncbi:hypothetical protein FH972_025605 [Carpinus fangiana]|uniref:Major facilitator superfamily (MFS) profile domain-containing protein n=1 Tax=Carpinus fangiana TaxID=176857 RepID=A0A5N6L236_9ROSI|nr:hypothetical protein FH972_025605 [Carpinus fangiana]
MGLIPKRPANEAGAAWPSILIGLFVAFGGVLYGYDTGLISGLQAMDYWKRTFSTTGDPDGPTSGENSLIVSILSAGTFVGALLAGQVADLAGRRWGIILSTGIVFNLGVIMMTAASDQPLFIAGRFFAGMGVGLVSAQIPLYQSEVLPAWIRGAIVGCYQLSITIGLFVAACVNYGTRDREDSGSYRIPVALQFLWSILLMSGMLMFPETPRFLIKQDKYDAALKSLSRLRRLPKDHIAVVTELQEIQANHQYELSVGTASYTECFKGTVLKRLITGCLIQSLQQLTGVNFIFYYGTQYFERAGFAGQGFTIQIITNVVNVFSTFPGLWAVDKLGRRWLLLIGAFGMAISQFIVAFVGTFVADPTANAGNPNVAAQRASIAFVCIYIFFFASTWGPGAWVVTGELFPLRVRAKCLSMTTASNWLLNFVIAFITPYLVDADQANLQSKVFFIWGSCCWACVAFVFFMIYETKNLTLEQVSELYGIVGKAWKSKEFRPQVSFQDAERGMSISENVNNQVRKRSLVEHHEDFADEKPTAGPRAM